MGDAFGIPPARVAVASKTGERIDECFGRAAQYRIYGKRPGGGYRLAETRPGPAPCRDQWHDPENLARAVELLSDCGLVLAGRIGPEAMRRLAERGTAGLAVNGLGVGEALERLSRRAAAAGMRKGGQAAEPERRIGR
ncbi:MAG: hypothetical protein LBE84_11965 [Planctomycetota bacterium]|jgi:predicted Fe-Mo cluster-binding NifX family protein|nr:hypothetical protein [Planctomycetota bacterium]